MPRMNIFSSAFENYSDASENDGGRIIIATADAANADFNAADKLDIDPQEDQIVMKGPLSEMFTQALNVMYSKTDPVDGSTALESFAKTIGLETQAMDYTALRDLKEALEPKDTAVKTIQVYGVAEDQVEPADVVDITKQLATSDDASTEYFFVFDGTHPRYQDGNGAGTDTLKALEPDTITNELAAAVESVARSYGCKIYYGLESFLRHVRIVKK